MCRCKYVMSFTELCLHVCCVVLRSLAFTLDKGEVFGCSGLRRRICMSCVVVVVALRPDRIYSLQLNIFVIRSIRLIICKIKRLLSFGKIMHSCLYVHMYISRFLSGSLTVCRWAWVRAHSGAAENLQKKHQLTCVRACAWTSTHI